MSFVSTLKAITNKVNSIAKAMDEKVEIFADEVLSIITDYDYDFFSRSDDGERDRADMKASIVKLFDMFKPEEKPKHINGYILFCQENREDCMRRNLGISNTDLTKALSVEWKALDDEERAKYNTRAKTTPAQTAEEKKAKRSASKKPSAPKVTCDYVGCDKVVKNPTQHTDGCTYCATHFKKVVADEKKAATPKCQHESKDGKTCTSDAINGEWCARHMKKSSPSESPKSAPVAAPVAEEKKDKNKSVSKKTDKKSEKPEEKKDAKDSAKEKLAAAEKKMAETKAKVSAKSSPASAPASPITKGFNFKTEKPVSITNEPEWWTCNGIKFDGVNKSRLHKKTGLVLALSENKLQGMFVDGKAIQLEDVSEDIKNWVKKCGIQTEDEEDMDLELDEELTDDESEIDE